MKTVVEAVNKLLGEESYVHPYRPGEPSKHTFYLVTDPAPEATMDDILTKVDIIGLARIAIGTGIAKFENENPQLYPESEKDAAITDAEMRMAALKDKKE
jgi:hypothetical protein